MNQEATAKFIRATGIRALKTFCQTLASLITVGAMVTEINWVSALSISATATVLSVLTSVATGLPEVSDE